jgi:hypothetical protein
VNGSCPKCWDHPHTDVRFRLTFHVFLRMRGNRCNPCLVKAAEPSMKLAHDHQIAPVLLFEYYSRFYNDVRMLAALAIRPLHVG